MNYTFRQLTSRPDSKGRCRILIDVTWENLREKLATGVSCQPVNFDADAKPGRTITRAEKGHQGLNTKLTNLVALLTDLFNKADAHRQPVTREQVLALVRKETTPEPEPAPPAPEDLTFSQLLKLRQREASDTSQRRYQQVIGHLDKFHKNLRLGQLTKSVFAEYLAYLHGLDMTDGTIGQHVKFLRIAHQQAERFTPTWLVYKARAGRAVALRREELRALASYDATGAPHLLREQQRTLFQTMLLLRDSDLRQLKAHHISRQHVPGIGLVLVLELYQVKTGDELRLPLPPLAAAIWEEWQGKPPVITQQRRNEYLKELAQAAGLDRTFVRVRFRAGKPQEEPLPLWQAMSTHTPRHTGADLVLWGSDGDQHLKEVALGHMSGASVYGYDTLERYGKLFLSAWEKVGAD